jgi:hypothetical protein
MPHSSMSSRRYFFVTAILTMVYLSRASACSVPVGRYALERCQVHQYRLTVFTSGPLSVETERSVATL